MKTKHYHTHFMHSIQQHSFRNNSSARRPRPQCQAGTQQGPAMGCSRRFSSRAPSANLGIATSRKSFSPNAGSSRPRMPTEGNAERREGSLLTMGCRNLYANNYSQMVRKVSGNQGPSVTVILGHSLTLTMTQGQKILTIFI